MAVLPTATGVLAESAGGTGTTTGYYGFKNKVINGAMQINQRAWSGTLTTNSTYTLDRWCYNGSLNSTISISQSTDAPAGFYNSLLVTSLANTTVGTGDFMGLQYIHEAQNLYDLAWQSSSPKTVTLSFWVKCSLVGTFGGSIRNSGAGGYSGYPFSYSIPTANTWTFITISVPVPVVTNGWGATNGYGMYMYFDLGTGTTYTAPANAWVAQNVVGANGTTKMVNTSGATWQFTGVQLEKGSTATSFDYRPYGTELQLCQRYYEKSYNLASIAGASTNTAKGSLSVGAAFNSFLRWTQTYKVPKRGDATFTIYSTTGASGNVRLNNASDLAVTIEDSGENASAIYVTRSWTLGDFVWWQWTASSEL
jgi:hypothetical protein